VSYKPNYETEVTRTVETRRHNTFHTDWIDWDNYTFDDPKHTGCMSTSGDDKRKRVEQQKAFLRICEDGDANASNYGGWPRIWHKVLKVGMASCWPYWEPRPTVLVNGTLGPEYIDWMSLTGAERIAPNKDVNPTIGDRT